MTEVPETQPEEAPEQQPAPSSGAAGAEAPKEPKGGGKKEGGFPVGQVAAGGLGATVLGSAALVSVVGPIGWLAAPAAATAGGVGYVAWKRRKKRGRTGSGQRNQQTKTTTTRTVGGSRLGGSGVSGARGRTTGSSTRSGGVGAAPRRSSAGGAGSARPASGGRTGESSPGGRGRASGPSPYSGTSRRGSAPRRGSSPRGGSGPRGGNPRSSSPRGGLFGRGSDTTSRKRSSRPGSSGGGTTPRGGAMPKNRWGGASGPTSKTGRLGRTARRARDWADKKTGGKASTAWKAARKKRGFRARTRAARKAVRAQGGGWFISGLFGLVAALAAGFAALFGWLTTSKGGKPEGNAPEDTAETPAEPDGHDIPDWVNPNRTTPDETNPADDKPAPTTPNTTGGIMSGLPAAQIAHDMAAAMSRYEPADAWAVVAEAKQWPDVSAQVAMSVKAYADRLEGARFPLNPAIVGKLQEYFQMLAASRSLAEELHPLLQRAHADDLARREAPRGDESKWNV